MYINDVVKGTTSNADTVMPRKFPPFQKKESADQKDLPRVFHR
jgi:hypothetical protein